MNGDTSGAKTGEMPVLGSLRDVVKAISAYNTSPDGSGPEGMGEAGGIGFLYGPGFVIELPTTTDAVSQLMVTITDEDFAWSVLMRMCRQLQWKMMDAESGRTFG